MKHRFKFLHIAMCMVLSLTVVLSSCKDYDDDINGLREKDTSLETTLNALNTQVTTLNTALDAAKAAAAEAKTQADAAKKAGDAAAAAAAEAKAAVETAKAAAISEAKAYAESLVADLASKSDVDALKSQLETLSGKVSGIDTKLNELGDVCTMDALTAAKEALQNQISALEKYIKGTGATDDSSISGAIETLKTKLGELETVVNGKITEAKAKELIAEALEGIDGQIDAQLLTLQSFLSTRLTSLSFIPSTYIDGIPAITFVTLDYVPQVFDAKTGKLVNKPNADNVLVANKGTVAKYHVNPATVAKKDVKKLDFVWSTAENLTRAIDPNNAICPIGVIDFSIDKGVMAVTVEKKITSSLNSEMTKGENSDAVDGPFYIASLVASVNDTIKVNSEYIRLAERTITTDIEKTVKSADGKSTASTATEAFVGKGNITTDQHYINDSIAIYKALTDELISWKAPYNEELNLRELVKACKNDGDVSKQHVALDEKAYGLAFRFALAGAPYNLGANNTDQQQFATVTVDGKMNSKVYTVDGGNLAAKDRQPIVRVSLVDTVHGNLVAQKYMKIKWTAEPVVVGDITLDDQTLAPAIFNCGNALATINSQEMNEWIYSQVVEGGMSKDNFHSIYKFDAAATNVKDNNGTIQEIPDPKDAGSYNLKWTLSEKDLAAKLAKVDEATFTTKVVYSDPTGTNGKVTIVLKRTITVPALSVSGHNSTYWVNQTYKEFKVNPIVYNNAEAMVTSTIWTDLLNGFVKKSDKVQSAIDAVAGYDCNKVDIIFDEEQLKTKSYVINGKNYTYPNGGITLNPDKTVLFINGEIAATIDNQANKVLITLEEEPNMPGTPTEAAKALVGNNVPVKIVADLCGDGSIVRTVKAYEVKFIKPLTINTNLGDKHFTDAVIDGSVIDCNEAFTFTDWNGYIVAKVTKPGATGKNAYAKELYAYYVVSDPVWDLKNCKVNLKNDENGNLVPSDNFDTNLPSNYVVELGTKAGTLVFKNNSGTPVNNAFKIRIPVTVTYKWGKLTDYVVVDVLPAAGTEN